MAVENKLLGYVYCGHCNEEVALKETKKGKAYYTCPNCGQMFFRTTQADAAVRAFARPTKNEEVEKDVEKVEPVRNDEGAGGKDTKSKRGFLSRFVSEDD